MNVQGAESTDLTESSEDQNAGISPEISIQQPGLADLLPGMWEGVRVGARMSLPNHL